MNEEELHLSQAIGICLKDEDGKVIYQNEKCLSVCGSKVGKVCNEGCMARYLTSVKGTPFDLGSFFLKNVDAFGLKTDCLLVNDGKTILTVFHESAPELKKQVKFLEKFALTKSEVEIAEQVLRGFENKKIAKNLCISEATLRTHLNNIYRKLPKDVREQLLFIHRSKKI